MNSLPIGTKIQSPSTTYTITGVLGTGGFGITYSAKCILIVGTLRVKANVALKEHFLKADCQRDSATKAVMYSQPARDRVERSKKDFTGEARRLNDISGQHPNIVTVSEVFEANNTAYYAMEMLEGMSLKEYVDTQGPLSEQATMQIMMPVIDAVAFLHRNRITHLDIKPHNIMLAVDEDGRQRPVLIDFGLSKHYDEDGNATSTINTQGYSDGYAPMEQYTGITTFSPMSDVYSLAATIVFCLTGRRLPVANELYPETLDAELPANITPGLRTILKRALSQRKDQRPKDADALMRMLGEDTNIMAPIKEPEKPVEEPEIAEAKVEPRRKNRWLIPFVVLAVVVGLAVAAWFMLQGRGDGEAPVASDTAKQTTTQPSDTTKKAEKAEDAKTAEDAKKAEAERIVEEAEAMKKAEEERIVEEAEAMKKAEEERKAEVASKAEEIRINQFLHSTPMNLDLCVTWNGKTGYISENDWQKMSSSEKNKCTKNGIYLSGDGQRFLLALDDLQSEEMNWGDAIAKYGHRLPTKAQGRVMADNKDAIERLLDVYGGHKMYYTYYWTITVDDSAPQWSFAVFIRLVMSKRRSETARVRAVAPVPVASAM